MPYNTRRKSLSLPSLGIHVPMSNAARAAAAIANANRLSSHSPLGAVHHSATSTAPSSSTSSSSSPSFSPRSPAMTADAQTSSRKAKRSHATVEDRAPSAKRRQTDTNTPPPSPGRQHHSRANSIDAMQAAVGDDDEHEDCFSSVAGEDEVDLSTINDDIVEKVVIQLQATRNRPHIVKELAAVLIKQLKIVQQSANPAAIISSRLSGFLKRPCWSANNPCPLAKELETVHPRRTYFYLTNTPHQPLPDTSHAAVPSKQARETLLPTPSATSASEAEDDDDMVRRRELSPSPEVDLSAPEFDDMDDDDVPMPGTPIGSFPGRHNSVLAGIAVRAGGRANSPPLEKDEKEFTQTADGLQRRKLSGGLLSIMRTEEPAVVDQHHHPQCPQQVGNGTDAVHDEHAKDESLFGGMRPSVVGHTNSSTHLPSIGLLASPAIRPFSLDMKKERETAEATSWAQLDVQLDWDRSPETVELDELDMMLTGF